MAELTMSDYRITPEEFPKMAENARATLGINFETICTSLRNEDCVTIYQESYNWTPPQFSFSYSTILISQNQYFSKVFYISRLRFCNQ